MISLGPDFLRRLESLSIAAGKLIRGGNVASRAGAVRGGRVEFLEHRGYVEGDDLRDLDWNLYARSDEPFVKVFGAEREKQVVILLDLSASMDAVDGKWVFAMRLAAALSHVALAAGDSVHLIPLSGVERSPRFKGLQASRDAIRWLEQCSPRGRVNWPTAVQQLSLRTAGACIVISDFWEPDAVHALTPLAGKRQDISLLQVLTPEELSPPAEGDVRLQDSETGEEVALSLTASDIEAYQAGVEKHIETIRATAVPHKMRHILCRTSMPFEQLVLSYLRRGGLLK